MQIMRQIMRDHALCLLSEVAVVLLPLFRTSHEPPSSMCYIWICTKQLETHLRGNLMMTFRVV
jgi:hypothetical protein